MVSKEKIRHAITLDKNIAQKLEKIAEKESRSFSNLVSVIIEKFLNDKK